MRCCSVIIALTFSGLASAQEHRREVKDVNLGGRISRHFPDRALAGNLTRKRMFAQLATKDIDRYEMMKQQADLDFEEGNDREAALVYDSLIKERPFSPEACVFQAKILDCVLRSGNRKMTVTQAGRLRKMIEDGRGSEECREHSERLFSNLAVSWHNECRGACFTDVCEDASEMYSAYLTLFPNSAKAYALRFFWAELLSSLNRDEEAAEEYTKVLMSDVAREE